MSEQALSWISDKNVNVCVCQSGAGQQSVGAKIARLMRLGIVQMWAMSNSTIFSANPGKFTPRPRCKSSLGTGAVKQISLQLSLKGQFSLLYLCICVHVCICVEAYTAQTPVTSQYPIITPLLPQHAQLWWGIRLEKQFILTRPKNPLAVCILLGNIHSM